MTNDYISRAVVLAHIKEAQCQKCSDIGLCGNCAVLTAVRLVESVPAADVAEAVRCRDCKHYDCENGDQKCVKDAEWDEETACYYGFISYHGPEFFCADGERKDGWQSRLVSVTTGLPDEWKSVLTTWKCVPLPEPPKEET